MKHNILKNRWVRMAVVPIAVFFTSTWYYGWQYLYTLLINEGTYSWNCDNCDPSHPGWVPDKSFCVPIEGDTFVCMDQENRVQSLYTIMSSMEFVGGIIAGVLYDMVGYRISLLIGFILHLIGFFGLVQSTEAVPLYYIASMCAGLSVNIVAYPGYYVRSLFPGKESSVLLLQLSAQWAGGSIMPFVYNGVQGGGLSFRWAQVVISIVGLPFVVIYYLTLPKNRASLQLELTELGFAEEEDVPKPKMTDVLKAFKYWDVNVFAFCWYLPLVMSHNAYATCVSALGGEKLSMFMGDVQTYQVFFSLGLAALAMWSEKYLVVKWLPFAVVLIGTFLGLLSLSVGVDSPGWTYTANFIFLVGNTFVFASKYVWAEMVMDQAIYGMVVGVISVAAGALQMTNIVWRSLAIDRLGLFTQVYALFALIAMGLGFVLFSRIEKGKVEHLMYLVTPRPEEHSGSLEAGATSNKDADDEYEYYSDEA